MQDTITTEEAKHKLNFLKKAYQKLIDEKVDSGKLVGDGVRGEWEAETPLDEVYKDMIESLDLAIKALEQQTCEDCFTDEEKRIFLASVAREMRVCEVIDSEKTKVKLVPILERVKDKVLRSSLWEEKIPSVTPKPGWIPCSERMPTITDFYLIQYSRHICSDEMAVAFYSVEEAESDKNYTWEFKPFADCKEVIAWMPLPEPYKAESEDENGKL